MKRELLLLYFFNDTFTRIWSELRSCYKVNGWLKGTTNLEERNFVSLNIKQIYKMKIWKLFLTTTIKIVQIIITKKIKWKKKSSKNFCAHQIHCYYWTKWHSLIEFEFKFRKTKVMTLLISITWLGILSKH